MPSRTAVTTSRNPTSRDPAHLAAILDSTVRLDRELVETHRTARASFDGAGFTLGGGAVRWTAGAEIDYEEGWALQEYLDADGGSHPPFDVIGLGGNTYRGERRRWSAFAVATLPLQPTASRSTSAGVATTTTTWGRRTPATSRAGFASTRR